MERITLKIDYLPWQYDCLKSNVRKKIIHKGRRLGLTRGMAQVIIEKMLNAEVNAVLWGDTVASNIDRYMQRYFIPILKQLPEELWQWRKQDRLLTVRDAYCDFRSADRPENWEGFGYDLTFLNEAGIILKDPYLWDNAVQPMLLDNPESELVIGGTPKGKRYKGQPHKFYELVQRAQEEIAQGNKEWGVYQFSTYDNPRLRKSDIDEMVRSSPEAIVRQEIYGEFIDTDEAVLIDWWICSEAQKRKVPLQAYRNEPKICGIDVGWGVDPTCMAMTQGYHCEPIIEIPPQRDDQVMASRIAIQLNRWQPDFVFIDFGYATGIMSMLQQLGWNVIAIHFGQKADESDKYANKRAEMYDRLRRWLVAGGSLPKDDTLKAELAAVPVKEDSRGRMLLARKDEIKQMLGRSPNRADALALTRAYEVHREVQPALLSMEQRDWLEITGQDELLDEDGNLIHVSGAVNIDYF